MKTYRADRTLPKAADRSFSIPIAYLEQSIGQLLGD